MPRKVPKARRRFSSSLEKRGLLTHEYLKSILNYDPLTGIFTWIAERKVNGTKAGQRAGAKNTKAGYRSISINDARHYEHVLAFFYMTGRWPKVTVDHQNLDKTDNRWINLREATKKQQIANRGMLRNNTSGFKGVTRRKNKWEAAIRIADKQVYLGRFTTPEAAAEAYKNKALELHGEFANVG